jgi:hypothetical protein
VDDPLRSEVQPAPVVPAGSGTDLVVRRPLGSFTREVPQYGKATLTFTENRLHVVANIHVEKASVTLAADADYSINRESVVYGVITGIELTAPGAGGEAIELAAMTGLLNDMPFAFRVRVEDDAITMKDLKIGPLGFPLFAEAFGKGGGEGKDMMLIAGLIGGKYKADPNPVAVPRKK